MSNLDDLTSLRREKLVRLYRKEPEAYAEDILGVKWWGDETTGQIGIARSFVNNKKTACPACHAIGKSFVCGGLVNYHFDLYDPSITLTTAPTQTQVVDVLWKEVRNQRRGRPGLMPKAPRMYTSDLHFAAGYTAQDATSFAGRHEKKGAAIFEEAVGVEGEFFDAMEGIVSGGDWNWVSIYNPTDTSSRMFEEEISGDWNIVHTSALNHPNIIAGLRNEPEPYPGAVSLGWVLERLTKWCSFVGPSQYAKPGDIQFPPGSDMWYRPGPMFESRVLGKWPSQGFDTVWNEIAWDMALVSKPIPDKPLVLGCDVARFGDDYTSIVARRGGCALHHERHNGWDGAQIVGRLKELCKDLSAQGEDMTQVPVMVDDDGIGGGVVDHRGGFNFIGISAAEKAIEEDDYPNRRSELWFTTVERSLEGRLDISRLSKDSRALLRRQLLTPKWRLDSSGRRVVEAKADMKKRLKKSNPNLEGGSPDDADALNLCFAGYGHEDRPAKQSVGHVAVAQMQVVAGYVPHGIPGGAYVPMT